LNRYAKHDSCSEGHQKKIYELKNRFLKLLYESGFAESVRLHKVPVSEKMCRACDGSGDHWSGEVCRRCDGTGVYREASQLTYVVFSFLIDGERYSWHQPEELVTWKVSLTHPDDEWQPPSEEKPLELKPSRFSEAKDLIDFVLVAAKDEPHDCLT
jgi:hypothetical protein